LDEDFSTGWTLVEPFGATLRIFFVAPNVAMAFLLRAISDRRLIQIVPGGAD